VSVAAVRYRLYGLVVESPIALPCPTAERTAKPDVRFRSGRAAQFAAARQHESATRSGGAWFRYFRTPDGSAYLRWQGLFEFLVTPDAREVVYRRLPGATRESFTVYLLGQVLSFALVARGIEALHATVVLIDGEAVAFLGECGYGKSTLGAAFLARGYPLLTDDLAALERRGGRWFVHPGVPRVKLFPSMAARVLGARGRGVAMNRGTTKLVLPVDPARAGWTPAPLRAVFVLADPARQRRTSRVRTTPLTGRAAFLEVIRAAFNLMVVDRARLENQFLVATSLVADTPIRRLAYPRAVNQLPEVCRAILEDLGRQDLPASAAS
jgi:hypothetical protein